MRSRVLRRGLSTEAAIACGIRSTAVVVPGAAVVMVLVFGVFAPMPIIDMNAFGTGVSGAILLDATMIPGRPPARDDELLGRWNRYLPAWLEWLPRLEHERRPEPVPQQK